MMCKRNNEIRKAKGISNEDFLRRFIKTPKKKPQNSPSSPYHSICIVLEGDCEVRSTFDNSYVAKLGQGEHFGSSDSLRVVDYEYFGHVFAGTRGTTLLVISSPDQTI